MHLATNATEEINPAEEAALRATVAITNIGCAKTAIQTAVTNAYMNKNEDWSQEGRKVMRELGLMVASPSMLSIA